MRRFHGLVLTLSALGACGSPDPVIERDSVERVLTVLSDDAMRGRDAFSPDADRAAAFIASEFAGIGLDELPDGGYHQTFEVFSVRPDSTSVVLNGRPITTERTAIRLSQAIHWTADSDIEVIRIGPDADAQRQMRTVFRGDGNRVVLMDPAHADMFERFQGFFARGSRTLDTTGGANTVLLLTSQEGVDGLEVHATVAVEPTATLANVIGTIRGRRADETVMFSGHYDHVGIVRPVDGDSIANGANDNASGTTAVIELARYFKALGRPERTLMFVAFAAEESGGYGSRFLADQLDPDQIVAMFNVEMIGKPTAEGPNRAWITGWDASNLGALLASAIPDTTFVFAGDPYRNQNLFYRSDNAVFARLGVPAHSISSTPLDVDPDYHRVTDEIGTLDLDHITATIRGIAAAVRPIVDADATPTRVDPAELR
jgi:hypothetical protein